ncbi:LamG-like jellyroll fold domain-containing protein [Sediminicola luteus]|nr:LamG-like jellyroll fold domain-containing protein [Sediminicola luteus]
MSLTPLVAQTFSELDETQQRKIFSTAYLYLASTEANPEFDRLVQQYLPPLALESSSVSESYQKIRDLYQVDTLLLIGKPLRPPHTKTGLIFIGLEETDQIDFWSDAQLDQVKLSVLPQEPRTQAWKALMTHWKKRGRMPNLIPFDPENPEASFEIVEKLNRTPKVAGLVHEQGVAIFDVHFKYFENSTVGGYFCLPMDRGSAAPELIPQKAGYYFSPDIVNITFENKTRPKTFEGFKIPLAYGLSHRFGFTNKDDIRAQGAINNRVHFTEDDSLGLVGNYDKGAYIDAGLESRLALRSSFSIIARIKPTQYSDRNSILGKGNNFVLKLHQGYLTFTVPGVKDYQSFQSPIPLNEWSQVGLVLSESRREIRFFVNGKLTESITLKADFEGSDYNLMMGSNLWEEYFIGQIKDIYIWDRELDESDVGALHLQPNALQPSPVDNGISLWWLLLSLLPIALFYFLWKRNRTDIVAKAIPDFTLTQIHLEDSPKNHIRLFGRFSLFDRDGNDIASRFSPMLKQIFLVVLLHSESSGKGISTKKLTEIIWPGLSPAKAKNTRGTNIQNLRQLLIDCDQIELVFKNKLWVMEIGAPSQCDLAEVRRLFQAFAKAPKLLQNRDLVERVTVYLAHGVFLSNETLFWLENQKEHIGNWVIENGLKLAQSLRLETQGETLYKIAEIIYQYDDLNEEALRLKLQVLHSQGKHSMALKVYQSYCSLYKSLYGTDYQTPMEHLSHKNTSKNL